MFQSAGCHTISFSFIHITIHRWHRRVMYSTYIWDSTSSPCQTQAWIPAFIITWTKGMIKFSLWIFKSKLNEIKKNIASRIWGVKCTANRNKINWIFSFLCINNNLHFRFRIYFQQVICCCCRWRSLKPSTNKDELPPGILLEKHSHSDTMMARSRLCEYPLYIKLELPMALTNNKYMFYHRKQLDKRPYRWNGIRAWARRDCLIGEICLRAEWRGALIAIVHRHCRGSARVNLLCHVKSHYPLPPLQHHSWLFHHKQTPQKLYVRMTYVTAYYHMAS